MQNQNKRHDPDLQRGVVRRVSYTKKYNGTLACDTSYYLYLMTSNAFITCDAFVSP